MREEQARCTFIKIEKCAWEKRLCSATIVQCTFTSCGYFFVCMVDCCDSVATTCVRGKYTYMHYSGIEWARARPQKRMKMLI